MSKTLELPTDAPAIIGQRYWVTCIRLGTWGHWIPTMGPRHEDAEVIGFKPHHYHIDVRFLSDNEVDRHGWASRERTQEEQVLVAPILVTDEDGTPRAYETKRLSRVCRRLMPHFPGVLRDTSGAWPKKLRDHCRDCKLKDSLICPHKGIPLKPFAEDHPEGSFAVCPGHGLCWNLTEKRLATPEEESMVRDRRRTQAVAFFDKGPVT